MKEKTKEFLKKYLIGFILGVVSACTISVIAATYFPSNDVTYDNSESGLSSNDVQGAIDELYTECTKEPTAGDTILDNTDIVTSGDGLYEDEYEDGRYFYKGGNPNNYVTFNNEQAGWRIVSIEPDGTIKIMRQAYIERMAWDSSNISNWARPASLNTYLNETYYNSLNSTAQSQIVAKDFSIGAVRFENNDLADQINDENGTKWNGKVALVTVSEYIRSNSNKSSCGSFSLNNENSIISCFSTGWMDIYDYWWTLSPNAGDSNNAFFVYPGSNVYYNAISKNYAIRPALYLSSEVKITGGDGSENSPFEFE